MTVTTFGPHLLGDLAGCDLDFMLNGPAIFELMLDMVTWADLAPIGSPHLDLYSGPHKEWEGYSATVHVQTSHITAHFFAFGYVFLDIFSCKRFDEDFMKEAVTDAVGATIARWQHAERGFMFPPELLEDGAQ